MRLLPPLEVVIVIRFGLKILVHILHIWACILVVIVILIMVGSCVLLIAGVSLLVYVALIVKIL